MECANNEIFDILAKHIIKIYICDEEIKFNNVEIKYIKSKFSQTYSRTLFIDGIKISGNKRKCCKVVYKCRCGRENKIYLTKYLGKNKIVCQHCLQDRLFDDHLETKPYDIIKGVRKRKEKDKPLKFEEMPKEFIDNFNKKNISPNEFYNYLPHLYKINNETIQDKLSNIIYKLFPTNNQHKFSYKISFDNGKTFNAIKSMKIKCSICGNEQQIHIDNIKNKDLNNLKCSKCLLTNHKYKIQLYDETGLTYQSNTEKYFLDKCKENNIKVQNGIKIPYYFNNSNHIYYSDFYLPQQKIIVEIKENNIWYKKDLESGKIEAKNNAAIEFGKKYNIKYKLLFGQYIDEFINNLVKEIV